MYKQVQRIDEDFIEHGEQPYFNFDSFVDYCLWLALLSEHRKGRELPPGWSAYELNALVDEHNQVLCMGQIRFGDCCDNITWAGHIGYTVPPSKRGNGYAKEYLRMSLERAWSLGFERAMLTCDLDNHASRAVIEHTGGEFLDIYTDGRYCKRRYWFFNPNIDKPHNTKV